MDVDGALKATFFDLQHLKYTWDSNRMAMLFSS